MRFYFLRKIRNIYLFNIKLLGYIKKHNLHRHTNLPTSDYTEQSEAHSACATEIQ